MNDRHRPQQFQVVTIYRGWLVAARFISKDKYQSVVVDPWDLEVGNSTSDYLTTEEALTQGKQWIDRYLEDANGLEENFN